MERIWQPLKEEYDPNLSKEDWLSIIKDRSICQENWLHVLARFYAYGGEGACSVVEDAYNEPHKTFSGQMQAFAKSIINSGKCQKMIDSDGNNWYFTVAFLGRKAEKNEQGSYIWLLREELKDALEEFDVLSWDQDYLLRMLVKQYKTLIEKTGNTEFIDDELYKWKYITDNQNSSSLQIIDYLIKNNLNIYDYAHDSKSWKLLIKDNPVGLESVINILKDENVDLHIRLLRFKRKMEELISDYPSIQKCANDERTAACFLCCWYPQSYTLYKDENLYKSLCEYLGIEGKTAGSKLEHFLELAHKLSDIVRDDADLQRVFADKTKGYVQSNLLIAQTIIWCVFSKHGQEVLFGKKRKYWSGGVFWGSENKTQEFVNDGYWKIGWRDKSASKGAVQAWNNIKQVQIGDYFAFHSFGGKNDLTIHYLAEVTEVDAKKGVVKIKKLPDDNYYKGKGPKMTKGSWFGTLLQVVGSDAINTIFHIDKEETVMIPERIVEYGSIIEVKKNVILQGAPGTGKTYSTAALALYIIGQKEPEAIEGLNFNDHKEVMRRYENYRSRNQIGFCTFHQSMDYEDFVEGLRPEIVNNGTSVAYDVKPGIFKIMCNNASASIMDRIDNFDEIWIKLIELLNKEETITIPLLSNKKTIMIGLNETGTGLMERPNVTSKYFSKEQLYNIYRGLPGVPAGGHDNYRKAIVAYMKNTLGLKEYVAGKGETENKNFVLIIDEINRGYVSRIFGELITLLEKDKRIGAEHPIRVKLPYSNEEDFGVPSNLYIIGTMNTTDRTTGTLDYALRRRFDFITLEADPSVLESSVPAARHIFEDVRKFIENKKLDDMDISDLMVGHSYFMSSTDNELKTKIRYEVIPLIKEYIKDGILNCLPKEADGYFVDWLNLKVHGTSN